MTNFLDSKVQVHDHPDVSVGVNKLGNLKDTLLSEWNVVSIFGVIICGNATSDDKFRAVVEQHTPSNPFHDQVWNLIDLTSFVLEHAAIHDMYSWRR